MQSRGLTAPAQAPMATPRANSAPTLPNATNSWGSDPFRDQMDAINSLNEQQNRKRPSIIDVDVPETPFPSLKKHSSFKAHFQKQPKKTQQTKIWQLASDPQACLEMDVAIADFVLSRMYDFALVKDEKFRKMLQIARRLPPSYKPPSAARIGGELLTTIYDVNWHNETKLLLKDAQIYGISIFGDGATIKTYPKVNAVASSVNNSFAMLDVFDCTAHMASGGVKDAPYIAGLFVPLINKLQNMQDDFVSTVCAYWIENILLTYECSLFLFYS